MLPYFSHEARLKIPPPRQIWKTNPVSVHWWLSSLWRIWKRTRDGNFRKVEIQKLWISRSRTISDSYAILKIDRELSSEANTIRRGNMQYSSVEFTQNAEQMKLGYWKLTLNPSSVVIIMFTYVIRGKCWRNGNQMTFDVYITPVFPQENLRFHFAC